MRRPAAWLLLAALLLLSAPQLGRTEDDGGPPNSPGCPTVFRGKDCDEPVPGLPSCLGGGKPYPFKFFTMTRRKFAQFLHSKWGRNMQMANRTVVSTAHTRPPSHWPLI
mmetsp:Transcript_40753/g.73219  ORF Transcript_40753/g.73219 Transcript_40753/m.73219 type:complete len:109 (-) Transcript_40753:481-807(-)|eukprot:CAMPEP_0177761994 /NCGR_PEP_ID=MMETSP0491_2-20121128/6106_1 /TAXON_ID=63592 /ORGANISM="Tetraselmis chuii, Strain PLY429" /LENGTH=108 /DNA_ID=CAMNT_0019278015 /DNA_START=896 /DNA_END=1222 /DNA_ORIENTATION=-